jgi:hypothetical protein
MTARRRPTENDRELARAVRSHRNAAEPPAPTYWEGRADFPKAAWCQLCGRASAIGSAGKCKVHRDRKAAS